MSVFVIHWSDLGPAKFFVYIMAVTLLSGWISWRRG